MDKIISHLKNIMLFLVCVLIGIIGAIAIQAHKSPMIPKITFSGAHQYQADSHLGFVPISHFSYEYTSPGRNNKVIDVHYDSFGARVTRQGEESSTTSDILVVGCSQTWGQGVNEDETFAYQLGKNLNMSVVNLGVSSYGGVGSLVRLQDAIHTFHPKYIVYGFWEDHASRNVIRCAEDGLPLCNRRPVIRRNSRGNLYIEYPGDNAQALSLSANWYEPSKKGYRFSFEWTFRKLIWNLTSRYQNAGTMYNENDKRAANLYVLNSMQALAKKIGATLIVAYIPSYLDGAGIHAMPQYMSKISPEIRIVNMERAFEDMVSKNIPIGIPGDNHLTPEAHVVVASKLAEMIHVSQG